MARGGRLVVGIGLVKIGQLNEAILQYLRPFLSKRFMTEVAIRSGIPLSAFKIEPLRGQYLSTRMLEILSTMRVTAGDVLLGIVDVDLYVPGLNFVFGEASLSQRVAVISVTRLRQSYYSLPEDENLLLERAGKEAVHEIGHILQLGHCRNPRCVMFFSNRIEDTDIKGDDFCRDCKRRLGAAQTHL